MRKLIPLLLTTLALLACGGEKLPLPDQPTDFGNTAVDDTTYLLIKPVWGTENGYDFNQPRDVLIGRDTFIYVADTDNNRIVMLDLAGNIVGLSQTITRPVAITQDVQLNLLIVNNSNKIFQIKLTPARHQIANAAIETVFEEVDNPDRRYTGISAQPIPDPTSLSILSTYFVCATGDQKSDNQVLYFRNGFDVALPDAVNLEPLGLGIQSAAIPSGITGVRDFSVDFIFCMIGQNSFKVQWMTSGEFGFVSRLNPAENADIFQADKFFTPEDVTVDEEGAIYVVDAELDYLLKFSVGGKELQSFGGSGSGEKEFDSPQGVAIFDQTLYVADTGNNRIVRFKLSTDVANN